MIPLFKLLLLFIYFLFVTGISGIGDFGKKINFENLIISNLSIPSLFSEQGYKIYSKGPCLFNSNLVTNTCPYLVINYNDKLELYDQCVKKSMTNFISKYHNFNTINLISKIPLIYEDLTSNIGLNTTIVIEFYLSRFPIWSRGNKSGIHFHKKNKGKTYFGHAFNLYKSIASNYYLLDNTWNVVIKLNVNNLKNYIDNIIFYHISVGKIIYYKNINLVLTKYINLKRDYMYYYKISAILSYFNGKKIDDNLIKNNLFHSKLNYISDFPILNITRSSSEIFNDIGVQVDAGQHLTLY